MGHQPAGHRDVLPRGLPRRGELLPRALAGHIMAQVEDPASLSRWDNPAYQLITLILIRCGLRISDATGLPPAAWHTTATAPPTCGITTGR